MVPDNEPVQADPDQPDTSTQLSGDDDTPKREPGRVDHNDDTPMGRYKVLQQHSIIEGKHFSDRHKDGDHFGYVDLSSRHASLLQDRGVAIKKCDDDDDGGDDDDDDSDAQRTKWMQRQRELRQAPSISTNASVGALRDAGYQQGIAGQPGPHNASEDALGGPGSGPNRNRENPKVINPKALNRTNEPQG